MSEENLLAGVLQAQVRVDSLPAARQIVAVERQTDGTWRIAGSGASDESGLAELLIQAQYQSDIYALAIDEWGSKWEANMVVAVGELVRPSSFVGWLYRVTQAGTLPVAEPDWWNSAAIGPQPVGTATLEAVRYYRPLAHGPLAVQYTDVPWTPLNLAVPPEIWLDWESDVTDVAGRAAAWANNKGSLGGIFGHPDSGARPTIVPADASVSGKRVIAFDGINDTLYADSGDVLDLFRNVNKAWIYAVYKKRGADTAPANRAILVARNNSSAYRLGLAAGGVQSGGQNRPSTGGRRRDSDSYDGVNGTVQRHGVWSFAATVADYSATRLRLFVDGQLDTEDTDWLTTGSTSNTASGAILVGSNSIGSTSDCADVDVVLILAGSSAISDADLERIDGWAAWELGLQSVLSEGHPYKDARPYL